MAILLVLGCSEELVDDINESGEQATHITEAVTEAPPAAESAETTEKEQLQQVVDAAQEPEKEEVKAAVETVVKHTTEQNKENKARTLPPDENMNVPSSPPLAQKRLLRGRVIQENPVKEGILSGELVHSGELILLESSLRHYRYTSHIPVLRGDIVLFSVMGEEAVIESQEKDERVQKKEKNESVSLQPEGTLLGRIRTVISTREGKLVGYVRDARTGEDFSYVSTIPLIVTEMVYYRPGTQPVEIAKEAK